MPCALGAHCRMMLTRVIGDGIRIVNMPMANERPRYLYPIGQSKPQAHHDPSAKSGAED